MKKIKTFTTLFLLLVVNIVALSLKNPVAIVTLFIAVCCVSIYITSYSQTLGRLKLFTGITFSILIFQLIFSRSIGLEMMLIQASRVGAQLFIVSEVVRVGVQYISPVSLLSLFTFLPKNLQLLIAMTFYFIPLTMKEYNTIKCVQISRGLGRSFRSRLFTPVAIIIPLLHRVFQRSEVISYSILARGWNES